MQTNSRGLIFALAGLAALLVVAVPVIHTFYVDPITHSHLDVLTSTYFTVETVATVGFGDYSFGGQSPGLQVFAIAFIVTGVTLVTTAFALFTNVLVSRRIEQTLGRRRVPGMAGHVVVVGLGSVGIRVVEGLLAEGVRVVVVEHDDTNRYLARARALDVPVVIADATQRQTHAMVNLFDASAVAILTSADLTNIETGLAVRETLGDRWDEVPVVLRVFDRDLARMMERNFGFRHVRSTSALAAPWFVGAALGPRRARDLLRRPAAVPGWPAGDCSPKRTREPGHARPVVAYPGDRLAAGGRATSSTLPDGAPVSKAVTRRTSSAPTKSYLKRWRRDQRTGAGSDNRSAQPGAEDAPIQVTNSIR